MTKQRPHVIVIGGPNGAGKSTTAPALFKGTLGVTEFANADTIAEGLSAFYPEGAAFHAGRVMLERIHILAKEYRDFAFETTLASRTFAPWLEELRKKGYVYHLVFLWLPSEEKGSSPFLTTLNAHCYYSNSDCIENIIEEEVC